MLVPCQNPLIAFHPTLTKHQNLNRRLLGYRTLSCLTAVHLCNTMSVTLPLGHQDPDLRPSRRFANALYPLLTGGRETPHFAGRRSLQGWLLNTKGPSAIM